MVNLVEGLVMLDELKNVTAELLRKTAAITAKLADGVEVAAKGTDLAVDLVADGAKGASELLKDSLVKISADVKELGQNLSDAADDLLDENDDETTAKNIARKIKG